jgi:hypothetical protein
MSTHEKASAADAHAPFPSTDEIASLLRLVRSIEERLEWLERNAIVRIPNEGG